MLYELRVASDKAIKVEAAQNAVTAWNTDSDRGDHAEIIMDKHFLPDPNLAPFFAL